MTKLEQSHYCVPKLDSIVKSKDPFRVSVAEDNNVITLAKEVPKVSLRKRNIDGQKDKHNSATTPFLENRQLLQLYQRHWDSGTRPDHDIKSCSVAIGIRDRSPKASSTTILFSSKIKWVLVQ